jgi:hypothetical protein
MTARLNGGMQIPTTYTGGSWRQILAALKYAVETANGKSADYPRISNGLAIAILQAWRKVANSYRIKSPFWPELWYSAFGYRKPGDRFNMTTKHAAAPAPADVQAATWEQLSIMSRDLDGKKATPRLLVLDLTFKGYEAAAKEAYERLKADRKGNIIIPPPPVPPGVSKPPPVEIPKDKLPDFPRPGRGLPTIPSLKGAGLLAILVIVALAMRKKR